jgi:hypothetical protein
MFNPLQLSRHNQGFLLVPGILLESVVFADTSLAKHVPAST